MAMPYITLRIFLFTITILICQGIGLAQDTLAKKMVSVRGLPVVYYLPETSLAFGGAGLVALNFGKGSRSSIVQIASLYTLRQQTLLTMTYDLLINKENWRLLGEISYFDYQYNFYGIGNQSKLEDFERYKASYPRLDINVYRKITKNISLGLIYQYKGIKRVSFDSGGVLDKAQIPGKSGGVVSVGGIGFLYDDRNSVISPYKGRYFEMGFETSSFLTSPFSYQKIYLDTRYYKKVNKAVVAFHFDHTAILGDAPFYDYYTIGSASLARGITDRRYMDKTTAVFESEIRVPLRGRFGFDVFGSISSVSNKFQYFSQNAIKLAYGLGLRYTILKNEGAKLRFDLGHSRDGFSFYFTTNEAF